MNKSYPLWIITFFLLLTHPLPGQTVQQKALSSWINVDMATGYETRLAPDLAINMSGWKADEWGNLSMRVGNDPAKQVVSCGLDRPTYSVSQITADGYLRVHRIGRGSSHPLWDQAHEAQIVRILTQNGAVAGVVARSNGHFRQQHSNETAIVTADDLWVDIGAESSEEVAQMGVELLDPLTRHLPQWSFSDYVSGPDTGARSGCAAIVTLAHDIKENFPDSVESTVFVLSSQKEFGWIGLSSFLSRHDKIEKLIVMGDGDKTRNSETLPNSSFGRMEPILQHAGIVQVNWLSPQVREPGSHMESLAVNEADWMLTTIATLIGSPLSNAPEWIFAPTRETFVDHFYDTKYNDQAQLLASLADRYGVSGHEWSVRKKVLATLPGWARDRARVDDIGNIIVEMGPEADTTIFMAHMDEVGYEVGTIDPQGIITLDRKGGAVHSAWEGQTALLHFDPLNAPNPRSGTGSDYHPKWKNESLSASAQQSIRGIFLTRDNPSQKDPDEMRVWLGFDGKELSEMGVKEGLAISSYKEAVRIGTHRFSARSLDDRAGSTALLLAIRTIDPMELTKKIFFVWSVHEESGHLGALALSKLIGLGTKRIYSVDTFVSSDTPLESPHFAHALLGKGPVLRAIENSGASPVSERAIVIKAARMANLPLQVGLTQGSTDGVDFAFWGAPNQGLSWPGRYSHSPGEVLDLRDLNNLAHLITAVALSKEP